MSTAPYDRDALLAERNERDAFLREHYASPIPEDARPAFAGAAYFDPDERFVVSGQFTPATGTVPVPSSTGSESRYRTTGSVQMALDGRPYTLTVLDDGDGGSFLPFGDETNGTSTYGGGRYVGVEVGEDGIATIDFNRAVNPYCAYDEDYSCPLPPVGNTIASAVEAGERNDLEPLE
jgi:uncharacterized protein (DUF1684 family)